MPYPVSVSMTPAFYDAENILLRTQLKCLSLQTCKDFDVWLIDPHYQKRKDIIGELASRFGLDIKHVPYTPNTRIAKNVDCAIFNAAYCYSQSPVNVRYSCYRFVRPTFIERILGAPKGVNVDFYFHAIGPSLDEQDIPCGFRVRHKAVWDFNGEDVDWSQVPTRSGCDHRHNYNGKPETALGNWPMFMDHDSAVQSVPLNIYGNIAWNRDQWLALNGTNEVITNASHWEDLDFDCRAAIAGQCVVRYSHLLYRLYHIYGNYSQRSNTEVDTPFKPPCTPCHVMTLRNNGDADYGKILQKRIAAGEVYSYPEYQAWVCKTCQLSGPIYDASGLNDYMARLRAARMSRSPILKAERIGRNLNALVDQMDKCADLSSKVEVYNDSWSNPAYYES